MDPGLLKVATTFFLGGFVGLATITNPLSKIPLFLSLAAGMSEQRSRHEARRACVYALVLLSAFLFAGVALAVVGNFFRSLFLSLTAHYNGVDALKRAHDAAGWTVLAFTAVGVTILAVLLVKILGESPWGPALQHRAGWDINIAPFAHASGALADRKSVV